MVSTFRRHTVAFLIAAPLALLAWGQAGAERARAGEPGLPAPPVSTPMTTPAPPPIAAPSPPAAAPQGRGGFGLSTYSFTAFTYTGDCPGSWNESWPGVSFRSETTAPAPFQRVRIANLDTGGFTDREYDERRVRSEPFTMLWLASHSGRALAVRLGDNRLTYQIFNRKSGSLVENGRFHIQVIRKERTEERDFSSTEQLQYCEGERERTYGRTSIYECRDGYYYNEHVGVCPDGSRHKIARRKVFNY